jgi:transcription elongation factor Elf1
MTTCKGCGTNFDDRAVAEEHVVTAHADVCDRYLEDYISDSQRDAQEELLEDDDEEG